MGLPPVITDHEACVACGHCCQIFWLNKTKRAEAATLNCSDRSRQWITQEVKELTTEEVLELDLVNRPREEIKAYRDDIVTGLFRCLLFNTETKRCTDYENRPPGCSEFPHYVSAEPNPYKDCSLYDLILAERRAAVEAAERKGATT